MSLSTLNTINNYCIDDFGKIIFHGIDEDRNSVYTIGRKNNKLVVAALKNLSLLWYSLMRNGYPNITRVLNGGCLMTNRGYVRGNLPEFAESFWTDSTVLPKFPQLDNDIHVDAVIVGGGITGITSAYLLANKGLKVAIVEADKLLNGTTG